MAFVTNFSMYQLPLYRRAVKTWARPNDFAVSKRDRRGSTGSGDGSLHYFGGDELGGFWRHFEAVSAEFDALRRSGATDDEISAWETGGTQGVRAPA